MKLPRSPAARIAIGFAAAVALFEAYLVASGANPAGILLLPLAVTVGPAMGVTYPFAAAFRVSYGAVLVASLALTAWGVRNRARPAGQVAAVVGLCGWTLGGFIGLGTGT